MSDTERDWLREEVHKVGDLRAPATLLPQVLRKVERRATQGWRSLAERWELGRSCALGLAVALLALLLLFNPEEMKLFSGNIVLRLLALALNLGSTWLRQTHFWGIPLAGYLVAVAAASYLLCIGAAAVVRRLAVPQV